MKLTFILLLLSTTLLSQSIELRNTSGQDFEIYLWKDSKVVCHKIMEKGEVIRIADVGTGILVQWRFFKKDKLSSQYFNHLERQLPSGFVERRINPIEVPISITPKIFWFRIPVFKIPIA